MRGVVLAVLGLALLGCDRQGDRTTNTVTGPLTLQRCSFIVFSGGRAATVSGTGGSTVSQGGVTYTISPDCSKVVTTTTTTTETPAEPAS